MTLITFQVSGANLYKFFENSDLQVLSSQSAERIKMFTKNLISTLEFTNSRYVKRRILLPTESDTYLGWS